MPDEPKVEEIPVIVPTKEEWDMIEKGISPVKWITPEELENDYPPANSLPS